MLFSNPFHSLNASLSRIDPLLFLSRNTHFLKGAVADDVGVNATSAPKPVTECHFFVKNLAAL
jgi:hypothetical protein